MERTDIYFVEDDTYFNNNVEGVEIHAECLSQDFDDIASVSYTHLTLPTT